MYKEIKKMKIGDVGIIFWNAYEEYDREGVHADIVYEVVIKVSDNKSETLLKTRNQGKAEDYFEKNFITLISEQKYDEPKKGIINGNYKCITLTKEVNVVGEKTENIGGDICEFYLYNYPGHQYSIENPYVGFKDCIDLV